MKKFTLNLKKCAFFLVCLAFCVFSGFDLPEEPAVFIQNLLHKCYDLNAKHKDLKRYELNITNTGFFRYRKVFNNGKEEYFAFNLSRFKTIDYYGTAAKGDLYIRTQSEDVIVQTRNDRKGEIDSMGAYIVIPLKDIDMEQLNGLAENFNRLNVLLANK